MAEAFGHHHDAVFRVVGANALELAGQRLEIEMAVIVDVLGGGLGAFLQA